MLHIVYVQLTDIPLWNTQMTFNSESGHGGKYWNSSHISIFLSFMHFLHWNSILSYRPQVQSAGVICGDNHFNWNAVYLLLIPNCCCRLLIATLIADKPSQNRNNSIPPPKRPRLTIKQQKYILRRNPLGKFRPSLPISTTFLLLSRSSPLTGKFNKRIH